MSIERPHARCEFRAASDGRRLEGYAATYNVRATIGPFVETIRTGAFRATLAAGHDILGLLATIRRSSLLGQATARCVCPKTRGALHSPSTYR